MGSVFDSLPLGSKQHNFQLAQLPMSARVGYKPTNVGRRSH